MVHVSTNEVFAGDNPAGYEEWMPRNPANPYGRSKAAGEVLRTKSAQQLLHRASRLALCPARPELYPRHLRPRS